jgi:ABC-type uncharacterized transport system permease subunit
MRAFSTRVFLGCIAGALAMLVFHQMTLQVCFWLGWASHAAYRVAHVPPFNAPMVVSITFWGAVYGGLFGLLAPLVKAPLWAKGMLAGLCAMALAWFVFLPLMGHQPAFGFEPWPMLRSFVAYQMWGLGMTLVLPLLHPRRLAGQQRDWEARRLHA